MGSLLERINRLVAARAALAARPALSETDRCARAAQLWSIADPQAPVTPENRRACRVAELLTLAGRRQAADIHSIA